MQKFAYQSVAFLLVLGLISDQGLSTLIPAPNPISTPSPHDFIAEFSAEALEPFLLIAPQSAFKFIQNKSAKIQRQARAVGIGVLFGGVSFIVPFFTSTDVTRWEINAGAVTAAFILGAVAYANLEIDRAFYRLMASMRDFHPTDQKIAKLWYYSLPYVSAHEWMHVKIAALLGYRVKKARYAPARKIFDEFYYANHDELEFPGVTFSNRDLDPLAGLLIAPAGWIADLTLFSTSLIVLALGAIPCDFVLPLRIILTGVGTSGSVSGLVSLYFRKVITAPFTSGGRGWLAIITDTADWALLKRSAQRLWDRRGGPPNSNLWVGIGKEEGFQPVSNRLVRFAHYTLIVPDYMVSLLDVRIWRNEGDHRIYALMGRGRSRKEFTRLEFRVRDNPTLRLRFELNDNEMRLSFQDHAIYQSEVFTWDLEPGQARALLHFAMARRFIDAAFNIPNQASEVRGEAVRDWLLKLEKHGFASRRDGLGDVGLGPGYLHVPQEIVTGTARVRVIADSGQHARYLLLQDIFNSDHYLVFETDLEGRTFDVASGAEIPRRQLDSRYSYNPIDYVPGWTFFQNMSRALLVTRKRAGSDTRYSLRPGQFKSELGLPLQAEYTVIKVQNSSSLTPTGAPGVGRRRGEQLALDSTGHVAYPLFLADPTIEKTEPLTPSVMNAARQNQAPYLSLPISEDAPAFLGYPTGSEYAYWKRLEGTITVQGQERIVYRQLSLKDEPIILQASMASDDSFTISGIDWISGPRKGQPVTFSGRINMMLLIAKYGDAGIISLPNSLRAAFTKGLYELSSGRYLVPEIVIRNGVPKILAESLQPVTSFTLLENVATKERSQLEQSEMTHALFPGSSQVKDLHQQRIAA